MAGRGTTPVGAYDSSFLNEKVPGKAKSYSQYLTAAMEAKDGDMKRIAEMAKAAWAIHLLAEKTEQNKEAANKLAKAVVQLSTMFYLSFVATKSHASWWLGMTEIFEAVQFQLSSIQETLGSRKLIGLAFWKRDDGTDKIMKHENLVKIYHEQSVLKLFLDEFCDDMEAEEAALSLLSMGHSYQATSSATLNSILTTTLPIIPQKRKHSEAESPSAPFYTPHTYQPPLPTPLSPPAIIHGAAKENEPTTQDTSTEAVDCICGFAVDDGFSIACDICSKWCHSACFGIAQGAVPEKFLCWACKPRPLAEKERAVRLQREKLGLVDTASTGGGRRRSSPGLERKGRRGTTAGATAPPAIETSVSGTGKKKRRPSIMQPPTTPNIGTPTTTTNGNGEDEHIDIDNEPWKESYVHIVQDIIPNDDTRAKLRQQAANWRGVTALGSEPVVVPSTTLASDPPISIKPLPLQATLNPFLSQNLNPHVLPPSFALHTTQPIPSQTFITPFRSCVTPSSTYLSDPLNAYAHLGMPKPYVHLLGPPLDLALDARLVGNQGRFVRWGCKPNAVLRPVLCEQTSEDEKSLGFGVFAMRDLKANEEVVLGWEWDDGNAIHSLPALLQAPYTFPIPSSSSPLQVQHLKNQYSGILHALSSTFTTCACGARARDCALTQMAAFVDGRDLGIGSSRRQQPTPVDPNDTDEEVLVDMGPLVGRKRGFRTKERLPGSGGMGGMEMAFDEPSTSAPGPSSSKQKGRGIVFIGKDLPPPPPSFTIAPSSPTPTLVSRSSWKGKGKAVDGDVDVEMLDGTSGRLGPSASIASTSSTLSNFLLSPSQLRQRRHPSSEPRPPDPPDAGGTNGTQHEEEGRMPPKMRKRWMHRTVEARRVSAESENQSEKNQENPSKVGLGIDPASERPEHRLMPPPPMPASLDPTTISSALSAVPIGSPHLPQQGTRLPQAQERPRTASPPPPQRPDFPEVSISLPEPSSSPKSPTSTTPISPQPTDLLQPTSSAVTVHASSKPSSPRPPPPSSSSITSITSTSSPLTGFATLSLLSPAIILGSQPRHPSPLVSQVEAAPPKSPTQAERHSIDDVAQVQVALEEHAREFTEQQKRHSAQVMEVIQKRLNEEEEEKGDVSMEVVGPHEEDEEREEESSEKACPDRDGDVEMTPTPAVERTPEHSRAATPPTIEERGPSTPLSPSSSSRASPVIIEPSHRLSPQSPLLRSKSPQSSGSVASHSQDRHSPDEEHDEPDHHQRSPDQEAVALPRSPEQVNGSVPHEHTSPSVPAIRDEEGDEQVDYGSESPDSRRSPALSASTPGIASRSKSRSISPDGSELSTRSLSEGAERVRTKVEEKEISVNGVDGHHPDLDSMHVDSEPEAVSPSIRETAPTVGTNSSPSRSLALPPRNLSPSTTATPSPSALASVQLPSTSTGDEGASAPDSTPQNQKVKLSLKDFAARRKKQKEQEQKEKVVEGKPTVDERKETRKPLKQIFEEFGIVAAASTNGAGGVTVDAGTEGKQERTLRDGKEEDTVAYQSPKPVLEDVQMGVNGLKRSNGSHSKEATPVTVDRAETSSPVPTPTWPLIRDLRPIITEQWNVNHTLRPTIDHDGDIASPSRISRLPPRPVLPGRSPPPRSSTVTNGHIHYSTLAQPIKSRLPARPRSPVSNHSTPQAYGNNLARPKQEFADCSLPPTPTLPLSSSNIHNHPSSLLQRVSGVERSASPINSDLTPLASRISSQLAPQQPEEDGEIGESSPPPPTRIVHHLPSKRDFTYSGPPAGPGPRPSSRNGPPYSSHLPPLGPRALFNPSPTSPSTHRPSGLLAASGVTVAASNPNSANRPPTGPRALRQMLNKPTPGPPQAPPLSSPIIPSSLTSTLPSGSLGSGGSGSAVGAGVPGGPSGGSQYIPRGPSADRDRDRDRDSLRDRMDWDNRHYRGPHSTSQAPRRSSGGYGHSWGR